MLPSNHNTDELWKAFFTLINITIVLCFLVFGYVVLEKQIHEYLNKPGYSDEELLEATKKRDIKLRQERNENWDLIEKGIHVKTGLIADENLQIIIANCTSCHSAKLLTQNRATREGWKSMIKWMQETQGLPDLGAKEPKILNYLAKHYAPKEVGRRANLNIEATEWYILNLE